MISLIGAISVLGVAVGVAALIVVMSIMNGFDAEVRDKIIGTYAHIIVVRGGGMDEHAGLISRIEAIPGVKSAAAFITGQAVLRKDGAVTGVLLKGVDTDKESEVTNVIKYAGGEASELTDSTIIPGIELMREAGISEGDTVELILPYSALDMEKIKLKVAGSFNSGRYDYDANMAVVSISTARRIFRMEGAATGIGLKVEDEMQVDSIKEKLVAVLGAPYVVKSWMDLDRNLVTALAMEKKMMFIILALIITVACFNISGSLIMLVMEKTRDIGILKAIGANSRGVSAVFLLQGSIIGISGVVLGALAGTFIAENINAAAGLLEKVTGITVFPNDIYYFTQIPVRISMPDVTAVVSVAMALTLAAGIYPAWKASRLDPVEAIRYE